MIKMFLAIMGFLGILGGAIFSLSICFFVYIGILAIHNRIMRK
jgi:hypothetical protein